MPKFGHRAGAVLQCLLHVSTFAFIFCLLVPRAQCVVCLERPKTHIILPCGHKCLCAQCAADEYAPEEDGWSRVGKSKTVCPMCREPVAHVQRVWD